MVAPKAPETPVVDLDAPLYGVAELATYLRRAVHTIRLDASRAPHRLPPRCRLPGQSKLLWRRSDVLAWIAAAVVTPVPPVLEQPRRRGRPRKETRANQRTA